MSTEAGTLPTGRSYPVFTGNITSHQGYLGRFLLNGSSLNPIDPEMCIRCGACVAVCPENAIDLDKCKSHRACVTACAGIGAINFERAERS